jgi:hypothetical protein
MAAYKEAFPVGSAVQVRSLDELRAFSETWKYHHPLEPERHAFAERQTAIKSVSFYHGGDVLYELQGIPGVWHEACLTGAATQ